MKKNCYEVLGLRSSARSDHINAAYKEKSETLRQRLDDGDRTVEQELFALRECFAILSNSDKRERYDEQLAAAMFNGGHQTEPVTRVSASSSPTLPEPETPGPDTIKPPEQATPGQKPANTKLGPCKTCGALISRSAKVCPHCGEEKPVKPASIGDQKLGCGSIIVIVFLALWIFGKTGGNSASSANNDGSMAVVMCEKFVKDRLKAPSTADFPWGVQATNLGGSTYAVRSYVDAQNGFGAMIRNNFYCKVQRSGSDKWMLVELDM